MIVEQTASGAKPDGVILVRQFTGRYIINGGEGTEAAAEVPVLMQEGVPGWASVGHGHCNPPLSKRW